MALMVVWAAAVFAAALRPGAPRPGFASLQGREFSGLVPVGGRFGSHGARTVRAAAPTPVETDEFKAARERIRRIQLGLRPDEPLPKEDGDEGEQEPSVLPQAAPEAAATLDLVEAGAGEAAPVAANVTGEVNVTDASVPGAEEAEQMEAVVDAYAGKAEDVEELKAEPKEKKSGPNIFQLLYSDLTLVTLPSVSEVAQTFGIVIGLCVLYTGFVALVDFGSQTVLGQVFEEFYKAARPEAA